MTALNLFGGFLKGYGQTKLLEKDREDKKAMQDLQKQMLQVQLQNAKLKQKEVELKNTLLQPFIQQLQQQQQAKTIEAPEAAKGVGIPQVEDQPAFSQRFQGEGGVASQMAGMQMAGMDPTMAALLKDISGIDFLGASRLAQDQEQFGISEKRRAAQFGHTQTQDLINLLLKLQETKPFATPTEEGGEVTQFLPKYGAAGLVIPTKRSRGQMPIDEQNLPLWIHPDTMESPQFGTTANQAQAQGYRRISTADKAKVNDFRAVSVLANNIRNLMAKVFPKKENFLQRMIGAAKRTWGAFAQTDSDAALLKSMIDGTQAAFVRMFEKGTLTDKDIARAKKLNIALGDDADVAWDKIENLSKFIEELKVAFVSGETKATQKQTEEKLPDSAIKMLKEGIETEFGNGQIWTLQNGQPIRIK